MRDSSARGPVARKFTFFLGVGLVWFAGLVAALAGLPWPSSRWGWAIFLILGPPAVFLVEAVFELFWGLLLSTRLGRWGEEREVSTFQGTLFLLVAAAGFVLIVAYYLF